MGELGGEEMGGGGIMDVMVAMLLIGVLWVVVDAIASVTVWREWTGGKLL